MKNTHQKTEILISFLLLSFLFIANATAKKEVIFESKPKDASAIPTSQLTPLLDQETLVYKAKFLGIRIGRFTFRNNGKTLLNNREVYSFELDVKTLPFFLRSFKAKDHYVSYMDAKDFVVVRHEEYIKNGTVLESAVDFNYETNIATHTNFISSQTKTTPIPDKIFDVLSGGYYLRMIPMEVGDTIEMKIYADEKIYDYVGSLGEKTTVDLPAHRDQEAYFFKPYLFLDGVPFKKISGDVLFSAEPLRKTLRASLKSRFGTVHVILDQKNSKP